jgi:hypothetical protein
MREAFSLPCGVFCATEGMKEQRRSRRLIATMSLKIDSNVDLLPVATPVINLNRALMLSAVNWPPGAGLAIRNPGGPGSAGVESFGRELKIPRGYTRLASSFTQLRLRFGVKVTIFAAKKPP